MMSIAYICIPTGTYQAALYKYVESEILFGSNYFFQEN